MKTLKHLLLAIVSCFLLSAGLAKAAELIEGAPKASQLAPINVEPAPPPCIIAS
jgi:hypothetical protein